MIPIKYSMSVILAVLLEASNIRASEPKTLMQDILTNPNNRWKNLPQLPCQLIGPMILHNHPIVPFILSRVSNVVKTLKDYSGTIKSTVFNSEGDLCLAHLDDGGGIQLWEAKSGRYRKTFWGPYSEKAKSAVFNIAGDRVVTCSYDNTPKLWETRSGKCLQDLRGHTGTVNSAVFNNSGDIILTCSSDGSAKLWDTNSGVCLHTIEESTRHVKYAKLSSSGDLVLTLSGEGNHSIKLWETKSGKCLHTLRNHIDSIYSAKFSRSGDLVVTISGKGDNSTVKLWETNSGKCLHTLKGHTNAVFSAEFNGSEDLILTASHDGTARLWDTSSGEGLKVLDHIKICSAKFNQLGDRILTRSSDGKTVKLWVTNNGVCLKTLKGYPNAINSSIFSSSGDTYLTASFDGTAKLWDSKTGEHILTLKGHSTGVQSADINSLENIVLLTGFLKNTVKHYDISLFQKLRNFFSRDDSITLNQAVVLIGIYEIIICRKLRKKKVSSRKLYFRRLKDSLKNLSSSSEDQAISSDRFKFDFLTCPHLQADYEMLPLEIQRILDKYVRKTASKNDCSTASTTDISDFDSASTSEES